MKGIACIQIVFLLTSGITSPSGEQCLVNGASLEPCLDAIAAGDGREIMQFDEDYSTYLIAKHVCFSSGVPLATSKSAQTHGLVLICILPLSLPQDGQIVSVKYGSCLTLTDGDTYLENSCRIIVSELLDCCFQYRRWQLEHASMQCDA